MALINLPSAALALSLALVSVSTPLAAIETSENDAGVTIITISTGETYTNVNPLDN